jgi:hypothetical protein
MGEDLWSYIGKAGAICITTNGVIRKDGKAVMGKGNALEAAQRWPVIQTELAMLMSQFGNRVHLLGVITDSGFLAPVLGSFAFAYPQSGDTPLDKRYELFMGRGLVGTFLFSLPTKHHWKDNSDTSLIDKSLSELGPLTKSLDRPVVLPRPGCGNGGLSWERDVSPLVQLRLPEDKYIIVSQ